MTLLAHSDLPHTVRHYKQTRGIEAKRAHDFAIANLNWTDRHVVRPQVECATAFEIEPGMVPMRRCDDYFVKRGLLGPAEITVSNPDLDVGVAFSFEPSHCSLRELVDDFNAVYSASQALPPDSRDPCRFREPPSSGVSSSRSLITATMSGCEIVLSKPIRSGLFR